MRISSLNTITIEALSETLKSPQPADRTIDSYFRQRRFLGSHDRKFIAEAIYDILRNKRLLEEIIKTSGLGNKRDPEQLYLAYRLGLEKRPMVEGLTIPGKASLERLFSYIAPIDNPAIRYSFSDWMVTKFTARYGEDEIDTLLARLNTPAPLTLRTNTLKTDRVSILAALNSRSIAAKETLLSPVGLTLLEKRNIFGLDLFQQGQFEVQDEGSQLISLLLDPKPNWNIADVCAGGGGKTLHLSALMTNKGQIHAYDVHSYRLCNLKKRARRAGAQNIQIHLIADETPIHLPNGKIDALLVDAPCSGSGVLRRNPDAKWKIDQAMIAELAKRQSAILRRYADMLKPGGRLVYATCSLFTEENEKVVESFLSEKTDFHLGDAAAILKRHGLADLADGPYLTIAPHRHDCDGFFAAVLQKD